MIINKIIANIEDLDKSEVDKRHIERVNLESDQLVKRIQRLTTDHDREIGLQLKDERDLANGDILYMDDQNIIMVNVLSDDLLVIRPKDIEEMGRVAHELGNRHLPAQFEGNEMLIQYDYLIEKLLQEMELTFTREERQVKHAFRHIGHSHD
ncbi:MAG TPA: urease accessory protein UreE [Flavobacteriaceae bacterium]|nr:urease accessory protein UreE [Flavobacteriaceae bacterium]